MAKFQEIQCQSCKRMIRNTDKFCIFCGEKTTQDTTKPKISKEEREDLDKDLGTGNIEGLNSKDNTNSSSSKTPFLVSEGSQDSLDDRVHSADENKNIKKDEDDPESNIELPEEIKDQLEVKMKLAIIENKKKKLKKKLKDLKDDLDNEKYEYDMDYAQTMNFKLNAFKTVKTELIDEEDKLRGDLGPSGKFRIDQLEDELETLRGQLIELKRAYKHHDIKRDVYETLKLEYSTEFRKADNELKNLRVNIIRWISKEKTEKNKVSNRIRLLSARLKTHDIDQNEYDTQRKEFDIEVDKSSQRIKILEVYSRPKKPKWY